MNRIFPFTSAAVPRTLPVLEVISTFSSSITFFSWICVMVNLAFSSSLSFFRTSIIIFESASVSLLSLNAITTSFTFSVSGGFALIVVSNFPSFAVNV